MVKYEKSSLFERWIALIGREAFELLGKKRVMIVGIGGVGSFAAEAMMRSGIGSLTVVDFDRVEVSNINRQLEARMESIGKLKVEVMVRDLKGIHGYTEVRGIAKRLKWDGEGEIGRWIVSQGVDLVIDAIDDFGAKIELIEGCKVSGTAIVTSTGAGGRRDLTKIRIGDLSETRVDRLAYKLRKELRKRGYSSQGPWGIKAVYSVEKSEWKGRGSGIGVTGSFGLACAQAGIDLLLMQK